MTRSARGVLLAALLVGVWSHVAAFEKKGYQLEETGGYLYVGPFVHNPTFAARPDNSGLVLITAALTVLGAWYPHTAP